MFRIRQSGSQSERSKVVVSYDDCGVDGDADFVDGDDGTDYVDDGDFSRQSWRLSTMVTFEAKKDE